MPTKAMRLPTIWYLLGFILSIIIEKMKVVMMVPPRIIWYIDPAVKFKANSWRVEAPQSQMAGMAIFNLLNLSSFPSSTAISCFLMCSSGYLNLRMRYKTPASIYPKNMASTCMGLIHTCMKGWKKYLVLCPSVTNCLFCNLYTTWFYDNEWYRRHLLKSFRLLSLTWKSLWPTPYYLQ